MDWYAISASLGAGLAVWGIAEPIYHFGDNPFMAVITQSDVTTVSAGIEGGQPWRNGWVLV